MDYVETRPAGPLAERVSFWRLRGAAQTTALEPVPPDGRIELIVHLGEPFRVREEGRLVVQPRVLVAGPGTRPVELVPGGRVDVIGVRIEAGAAPRFLGDLEALVDRVPALDEFAPRLARELAEELADARGDDWTVVLERRLASQLDAGDPALECAVARVRASHGRASVRELAEACGLSPRQLERRFRARVGYGPKLLARIARFQRAWELLRAAPHASGAELAARAGYYDQAHLVKDFRQFAGEPPRRFLAGQQREEALAGFFAG